MYWKRPGFLTCFLVVQTQHLILYRKNPLNYHQNSFSGRKTGRSGRSKRYGIIRSQLAESDFLEYDYVVRELGKHNEVLGI